MPKCPKCGCEFGKEDIKKKAEACLRGLEQPGTVSFIEEKTTYVTGILNSGHHFRWFLQRMELSSIICVNKKLIVKEE